MAIGTFTMILTNVGLSIFNNWAGSRQNKKIAEKREEFERAARDGQRDRMLQLMREGQELTLQMEKEKHQERLKELNDQFDNLIKEMTYSAVIDHWPLKTLPIVMKNQAFGNLLAKQEEKVALHCILTPSNCYDFNQYVMPKLESALEEYCNIHWSNLTSNPILFYSGAWNGYSAPTETQITTLHTALNNLPFLLITPFFRLTDGKLVFHVYTWGVGYNQQDQFYIPVIEPTEFQRDYTNSLNWSGEDHLIEDAVEDLVPYLQCMIGYIADTYFWSVFGSKPQLPSMLADGIINTDGMIYLKDNTCQNYNELYIKSERALIRQIFSHNNLLSFISGASPLWTDEVKSKYFERIFATHFSLIKGRDFVDINDVVCSDCFSLSDLPYLKDFYNQYTINCNDKSNLNPIHKLIRIFDALDCDYSLLNSIDVDLLEKMASTSDIARYRLGEMYEFSIGVKYNKKKSEYYYSIVEGNKEILIYLLKCYYISGKYPDSDFLLHQGIDIPEKRVLKYLSQSGIVQASLLSATLNMAETRTDYRDSLEILEGINEEHPYKYYLLARIPLHDNQEIMLRKSADMGYLAAQEQLCMSYKDGNSCINENPSLHAHYAELGMLQGSSECTYEMALCYFNGYGVGKSYKTGLLLLEKAAQDGHPKAKTLLDNINNI